MTQGFGVKTPNFIYDDCQECGKALNDMEKDYCQRMQVKTNQIVALCSTCLDKNHGGQWPAISVE